MSENEIILSETVQQELPEKLTPPEGSQTPPLPPSEPQKSNTFAIVLGVIGAILLIAALVFGAIYLVNNEETASTIRDIFIILVALEFMLIGWVLVVLIIQLAKLINMLQNEVQPMIDSTNDAVNTIRGTSVFISENLTEPIIKLNSYVAALNQFTSIFTKKGKRKE